MNNKVLCSTGALIGRPNGRNYKLLKEFSKELQCDGFEFMLYDSWYEKIDEVVTDLQQMQLNIPVMHCEKRIGQTISKNQTGDFKEALRLFEINCKVAKEIGAGKIVIHLWDGLISDSNFQNNLKAFGELLSITTKYNVDLLVENVVCNVENPMKHWEELVEKYQNVHFVFDTKMAAFHNQMPLIYKDEYQWLWDNKHIRHLHINDYNGGYMEWDKLRTLPIGKGNIDFESFFELVKKKNYAGDFTVEATAFNEKGEVDLKMLNWCFDYIRGVMNK